MDDVAQRCTDYLSGGGLFNPELADHDAVRDLIIDCRDYIERLREDLRLAVMSDTEYCKAIEDDNKRLREALRDVIPYIDTCNSEHRDAQERAKNALKEKE